MPDSADGKVRYGLIIQIRTVAQQKGLGKGGGVPRQQLFQGAENALPQFSRDVPNRPGL